MEGRRPIVWAVIPVKSFDQSKTRLSSVLTPEERVGLCRGMLHSVIAALRKASALQGWMVISKDASALALAVESGGHLLVDSEPNLNASLRQAALEVQRLGGEAILIVPVDVPLVSPQDIDAMVSLAREDRSVVVAPSRRRDGTNALLLRPPQCIPFSFGPESFETHQALAKASGVALSVYSSDSIGFDVDTVDDWRELRARAL